MDTRSTGEVVASLIVNAQAMIAKEVELVGLELRRIVGRKLAAVAILLVGALSASAVLLLGAVTAAIALEGSFAERWMAWGVVTLAVALVALLLFIVAARMLSRGWSLGSTRRNATSTGEWLRALGEELTGGADAPEDAAPSGGDGR
jgi:O-antigen ligase